MTQDTGKQIMQTTLTVVAIIVLILVSALVVDSIASTTLLTDSANPGTVTNETAAWLNETDYTLTLASTGGFASPVITAIWGAEGGEYNVSIATANASVTSAGVVTNATVYTNDNVSISYTYTYTDGTNLANVNVTYVKSVFGLFVTALLGFFAIIGVIIAIVWLVMYIRPLFDKKDGIQSFAGN